MRYLNNNNDGMNKAVWKFLKFLYFPIYRMDIRLLYFNILILSLTEAVFVHSCSEGSNVLFTQWAVLEGPAPRLIKLIHTPPFGEILTDRRDLLTSTSLEEIRKSRVRSS